MAVKAVGQTWFYVVETRQFKIMCLSVPAKCLWIWHHTILFVLYC